MRVNLNWNARPEGGGGFFRKHAAALDLDLGCLYEFTDGTKGVVQALGNTFTARDGSGREIIRLDGDDRSGNVATGENLSIDLSAVASIRRVLVFALIYEGAANWAAAEGIVTMFPVGAAPVEVRLDDPATARGSVPSRCSRTRAASSSYAARSTTSTARSARSTRRTAGA